MNLIMKNHKTPMMIIPMMRKILKITRTRNIHLTKSKNMLKIQKKTIHSKTFYDDAFPKLSYSFDIDKCVVF